MSSIGVQHIMQHIHMIQHRTGTLGHAIQRVIRNMDVNAGLTLDQLIQTAQQSAAASQGDAAVDDICAQFRRTSSECTTMFLGRPSTRLRPLISMVSSGSSA